MAEYCVARLIEMAFLEDRNYKTPYAVVRAKLLGSSYDKPNAGKGCPKCQSKKQ